MIETTNACPLQGKIEFQTELTEVRTVALHILANQYIDITLNMNKINYAKKYLFDYEFKPYQSIIGAIIEKNKIETWIDKIYLAESCYGCRWNRCGQRDHMGPNGCLNTFNDIDQNKYND
jgi:hypothetical protein